MITAHFRHLMLAHIYSRQEKFILAMCTGWAPSGAWPCTPCWTWWAPRESRMAALQASWATACCPWWSCPLPQSSSHCSKYQSMAMIPMKDSKSDGWCRAKHFINGHVVNFGFWNSNTILFVCMGGNRQNWTAFERAGIHSFWYESFIPLLSTWTESAVDFCSSLRCDFSFAEPTVAKLRYQF